MIVHTRLATAICISLLLGACTQAEYTATDSVATDTAPGAIQVAPAPASGAPQTGAQPATPGGEADVVHVPLNEWTVSVSKSVITPGTTTFHAMNQGSYTHAFEIEGNGQEWKSSNIPPGGTATLTPTLSPGTYEVYCPIVDSHGNHQQRGMRTTFTVR